MVLVSGFDGKRYQERFDALEASGMDVHGEATLVRSFRPSSVLDAGCGTGRVSAELARHGIDTVGVDLDASMIAEARRRAPALTWVEADMSVVELGRAFDVVVMAGNVPLFCPPGARSGLVRTCAVHLVAGGVLICGFQLDGRYSLEAYDGECEAVGLALAERWATWDRSEFVEGLSTYAVSVHR